MGKNETSRKRREIIKLSTEEQRKIHSLEYALSNNFSIFIKINYMKKIIPLFLLLFLVSVCNAQTEKETITFLNKMFAMHPGTLSTGNKLKLKISKRTDTDSNKRLFVFTQSFNNEDVYNFVFNAKDISVVNTKKIDKNNIALQIVSSDELITVESVRHYTSTHTASFFEQPLTGGIENEAKRIKKALIHLFKINGAKFTNENLFKN